MNTDREIKRYSARFASDIAVKENLINALVRSCPFARLLQEDILQNFKQQSENRNTISHFVLEIFIKHLYSQFQKTLSFKFMYHKRYSEILLCHETVLDSNYAHVWLIMYLYYLLWTTTFQHNFMT